MLVNLWTTLKALAASRKVMLAVITGLIWVLGRAGLAVTESDLLPIVGPLWAGIFGIAVEDVAKHAAAGRVAASAAAQPAAVTTVTQVSP